MPCAAQAAALLAPFEPQKGTLLDAGCGSGYFYHSLASRNPPLEYYGIDATPTLIDIGKEELSNFGLAPERLRVMRIEELNGSVDFVLCMNVLTYLDNFHAALERLLKVARVRVILRESLSTRPEYAYVTDTELDNDVDLKVHINTYELREVTQFIEQYGFEVQVRTDEYTGGTPETFLGRDHHWKFIVATRRSIAIGSQS